MFLSYFILVINDFVLSVFHCGNFIWINKWVNEIIEWNSLFHCTVTYLSCLERVMTTSESWPSLVHKRQIVWRERGKIGRTTRGHCGSVFSRSPLTKYTLYSLWQNMRSFNKTLFHPASIQLIKTEIYISQKS